ncbi:hypothetical protein [Thermococcus stetteri]|uniref:hypothetical protein n=1 Tax=Thermococcus stetteri TaxID=49900 RepID=UPI001AE75F75|nr:hypothetical protein [Thermococcus stetteri]MBP1912628.1 hypothetical protein [Thermococcus stetteri]
MGAVKKGEDRSFPIRPDSWYLVVYFDEGIHYLSIPSSSRRNLERLVQLLFVLKLSERPYRVFGIAREGVYELGEEFIERVENELGASLKERMEKDATSLLRDLEKMEEFYSKLGFIEDLEEVEELKEVYKNFLKKIGKVNS